MNFSRGTEANTSVADTFPRAHGAVAGRARSSLAALGSRDAGVRASFHRRRPQRNASIHPCVNDVRESWALAWRAGDSAASPGTWPWPGFPPRPDSMNLPGRLRLTTLGDVLGTVYRDGVTGILELTESHGSRSGSVHRIHVAGGLVAHVETPISTARLGEVLRKKGILGDAALARLGARISLFPHKRAGELLVLDGAATESDVAGALRLQRRERLERLFLLDDARLAFHIARGGSTGKAPPLHADEYLHGRPRSREKPGFRKAVPARRRDPVRSRALSTLGLSDAADPTSVQRAFRRLAATMHPDRFPTAGPVERAELMRRFAEITAAYHSLVA
jgi:DnaJ domain